MNNDYKLEHYRKTYKREYLGGYSCEKKAFDYAVQLSKLHSSKLLTSSELNSMTGMLLVTVDYNYNYNIVTATGESSTGIYSIDKKNMYEVTFVDEDVAYKPLAVEHIIDFLEKTEIYLVEFLPHLGIFNIKTKHYIEKSIEKYPEQFAMIASIEDKNLTTCEDYLIQYKMFWKLCKSQNYAPIGSSRVAMINRGLIPLAHFIGGYITIAKSIIEDCIAKCVLKEHFKLDISDKIRRADENYTTIYWVSFKNAVEFMDMVEYTKLSPPDILETLLANYGYIESNLCGNGEKIYEEYIDEFGIKRARRLYQGGQPDLSAIQPKTEIQVDEDSLEEVFTLEDLFSNNGLV